MAVICPKCQHENPEDTIYCGKCGTQISSFNDIEVTETIETPKEELTTGSTFAGRYQIIEELGKGGMGRVYKALDKKINEKIALKLIKPEIASDKKIIERFRNELKFARKIRHKNVCQMFDLGEEKGPHFITMEYVAGEDLKRLIRKMNGLSSGQAIAIAKQVCEGLTEAHRLGVMHRDLKPQNIMVDEEGSARIMDFGIARSLEVKGITGAGVMIGTPEYMSPEQVEGKDVDHRSDIYSLGVILYEMVTGKVPFEGDTPFTIGVKYKSEAPQPPKELNDQIPEDLNQVILRCLEKDKEKRYQSASEVHSELESIEKGIPATDRKVPKVKSSTSKELTVTFSPKKLWIPALVLIALVSTAVILWKILSEKKAASEFPAIPTVAVLPFEDLSPQKDQEIFCHGISEYIISKLTKLKELKVIQGDSAIFFMDTERGPQSIGKELQVDAVLHGSVQISGRNLLVLAKLMDVADGSLIWANDFTEPVGEALSIQNNIALQIAGHLKAELSSDNKEYMGEKPTENMEAYNLYVRGRYFWRKRGRDNVLKSIQFFEQAIELDPEFALAYAGLADSYISLTFGGPMEKGIKIKEYAQKALELDDTLAEAHTALAGFKLDHEWDFKGAKREFEQAIALNPGYATAHHWYGRYFWWTGETDNAIHEIELARGLDPLSPSINRNLAWSYIFAEQYDLALEALNRVLEIDPHHIQLNFAFGFFYLGKENYDKALEEFIKAYGPDSLGAKYWEHYIWALKGETDKAREWIELMEEQTDLESISYYFIEIAFLWAELDEPDKVFFYLNNACENHDPYMFNVQASPLFDDYRSDPRYDQLLKKMGLAE